MVSKDSKKDAKNKLMDDLKSIKGVLDDDDDNVPLLLGDDDDDIPVLGDADDDVPVLTSTADDIKEKASLEAALRQLESMELAPKAKPIPSLEEKIRSNAAPPLAKTAVRENPFINQKNTDRFAESRKQAEAALQSVIAHSKAAHKPPQRPTEPVAAKPEPKPEKATPVEKPAEVKPAATQPPAVEEDASAAILKLLDEKSEVQLDIDDEFGELVDIDVDALIAEDAPPAKAAPAKTTSASAPTLATKNKASDAELNAIIDDVVEEYIVILEAALKKKLKEKLPDLLKK